MQTTDTQFGYVAIVGRPNVGKSTLLNRMLGTKLSITSRKPQTTRQQVLGIKTLSDVQVAYIDTPGLHKKINRRINTFMNQAAINALDGVDVVLFLVDGSASLYGTAESDSEESKLRRTSTCLSKDDRWILDMVKKVNKPVILAVNKVDKLKEKEQLLPFIEKLSAEFDFYKIIPISAKKDINVDELEAEIRQCLPDEMHMYPPEQLTNRNDRFVAAEMVREKLMRLLGQEIPYALTVSIEAFEEDEKIIKISAIIWVERDSQKSIVIGKGGALLKKVGEQSRRDMEQFFEKKVFLKTWVKVKSNWSDDDAALEQFGYK